MSFLGAAAGMMGGGLMSLGGTALSAHLSAREAKKNRKFQERMARHSYRYGMQDMRKAGLNPILAYQKGGAATPSGSSALMPNFGDAATKGALAGASSALMAAQSSKLGTASALDEANTAQSAANAASIAQDIKIKEIQMPRVKAWGQFDREIVTPALKTSSEFIRDAKGAYKHQKANAKWGVNQVGRTWGKTKKAYSKNYKFHSDRKPQSMR